MRRNPADGLTSFGKTSEITKTARGAIALCSQNSFIAETGRLSSNQIAVFITNYETKERLGFIPLESFDSIYALSFSPTGQHIYLICGYLSTESRFLRIYSSPWCEPALVQELPINRVSNEPTNVICKDENDFQITDVNVEEFRTGTTNKLANAAWMDNSNLLVADIIIYKIFRVVKDKIAKNVNLELPNYVQPRISILNVNRGFVLHHKIEVFQEDIDVLDSVCSPSGLVIFLLKENQSYHIKSYKLSEDKKTFVSEELWPLKGLYESIKLILSDDGRYLIIQEGFKCFLFSSQGVFWDELSDVSGETSYSGECFCSRYRNNLKIYQINEDKFREWSTSDNDEGQGISTVTLKDKNIIAIERKDCTEIFELQDIDILYLRSHDLSEQLKAIRSLANRQFSKGIPELARLIFDENEDIQKASIDALIKIGSISALPYLLAAIGDKRTTLLQKYLISAVRKFPLQAVIDAVAEGLDSPRVTTRRGATLLLEQVPSIEAVDKLCEALSDADKQVRQTAANALRIRADLRACTSLLSYLNDEDLDFQSIVQEALKACLRTNGLLTESINQQIAPLNLCSYADSVISAGQTQGFEQIGEQAIANFTIALALACANQPLPQILNAIDNLTAQQRTLGVSSSIALTIALICADVMRQQKRWKEATRIYKRAIELAAEVSAPQLEWKSWYALGECAESDGNDKLALSAFQNAMEVIDRLWFALLEEEKLRDFFQDKAQLYDHAELCCLRLGHTALALECREKAKTRYLGDLIARRQKDPRVELEQELKEFWRELDKVRPIRVSINSTNNTIQRRMEIVGVEWGEDESQAIKPECLAAVEEVVGGNDNLDYNLNILQKIWELMARVSLVDNEEVREYLENIYQALLPIHKSAELGMISLSASEQSTYIRIFQEAAEDLLGLNEENSNVPYWVFWEYRHWLKEICEQREDVENRLLLDAVMEALNVVLHHMPILGVPINSEEEERAGFVFTTRSLDQSANSDNQRTAIVESAFERVSQSRWHYAARLARGEVTSFREIKESLIDHPQTAQLEFSITEQGTAVYIIHNSSRSRPKVGMLPDLNGADTPAVFTDSDLTLSTLSQVLTEGEESWLACYQNRSQLGGQEAWMDAMDRIFAWLYQKLIVPIDSYLKNLGIQRLWIVPNRSLHLIPFAALHYTDEFENRRYLIDDYEIMYAPSATLQQICRERAAGRTLENSLTAIANPTEDLIYAAQEVEALSKLFPPSKQQILRGKDASLAEVLKLSPSSFYHFSCHGTYDWQQPLTSALLLAQNERLHLSSLFEESIVFPQTMVAILSACETGVSNPDDLVDEYIGLAAGFLFAGVPCVVSSLWAVDDLATMLLMTEFYRQIFELRQSEDSVFSFATALCLAQQWLRQLKIEDIEDVGQRLIEQLPQDIAEAPKARLEELQQKYKAQGTNERKTERHFGFVPEALQKPIQVSISVDKQPFAHPYYWASFTLSGF